MCSSSIREWPAPCKTLLATSKSTNHRSITEKEACDNRRNKVFFVSGVKYNTKYHALVLFIQLLDWL